MKAKTRSLVLTAILIAIMLVFGFTPIGYIPLPFARLTLMCLPVIIGTLVLGIRTGMGLSLVFIITSIAQLFIAPDVVSSLFYVDSPALYILCLILPRLAIPITTTLLYTVIKGKSEKVALVVSSAVGSLTNTFLYLLLLQLFFVPALAAGLTINDAAATGMIWGVVLTNGLPEAAIAAVACPLIVNALKKSIPPIATAKQIREERTK